jgi:transposase-like protein
MERRSKAETEKFYRELIAEQKKSGQTIRAFAEARGVPAGTLSSWRHHLKKRDAEKAEAEKKESKPAFVPVSVVKKTPVAPKLPQEKPAPTRGVYEVVLGRDRVLRLPADFDEARAAALMRAVASC